MAERSEAGWGIAQRVIDQSQHALEIPIDFIVPETQYPEALADKMFVALRVAPRMRIEIMLTAVDLDDEALLETDEIDDIVIARSLAAEVESPFSPGAQVNPQFHLLRGQSFAKAARDFVSHSPHPASLRSATLPLRGRDSGIQPAAHVT